MLHCLGQQQAADQCILQEDQPECFLEVAATNDGAYITINSNAKTASEVAQLPTPFTDSSDDTISCVLHVDVSLCVGVHQVVLTGRLQSEVNGQSSSELVVHKCPS